MPDLVQFTRNQLSIRPVRIAFGAMTAIFAVVLINFSWFTVDQGERGVVLRNGAVSRVAEPGLGFKLPFFDQVVPISVQSQTRIFEKVVSYSHDQQPAEITISVNYHVPADRVADVYASFGSVDGLVSRLLDRRLFQQAKNVFGQFSAASAIQERARLNAEVARAVQDAVDGPIAIDSVQIESINFSDTYENSIEARMLAEVEVAKLHQNAEREKIQAAIVITQAQGRAAALLAEATASAQAIRLKGEAEAAVIEARGLALRDNAEIIKLVQAEKWNGQLPETMVPGSSVPFLELTTGASK